MLIMNIVVLENGKHKNERQRRINTILKFRKFHSPEMNHLSYLMKDIMRQIIMMEGLVEQSYPPKGQINREESQKGARTKTCLKACL
jgi:hypothetical protein